MRRIFYLNVWVAAIFLASCGGGAEKKTEEPEFNDKLESFAEEVFDYPIPTSYQVTNMLLKANANYVFDITNDPANVNNYVAEWQKAMNLGVYGADLSYSSTYNRQEETVKFLDVSRQLIEDLNIGTAFNASMVNRIESNIENKDSLILIITESFHDTYNHLNKNGQEKNSILVIAGSVIEGLHITAQLVISSDYNEELLTVLANQKTQVKKLVELMEAHAEDENVNKVLPKLRFIDLFYDQLGDDTIISRGQFEDIYNSIKDMRKTVIG
ncbi:MAG: hypothetical protein JXQ90_01765 [Cyclobacteriaceae bacterium]